MAGMATALTEFSDNGNSRTFTTPGHTSVKPKLVIQKRKIPANADGVAETSFIVIHATVDADGNVLSAKESFEVIHRSPVKGDSDDRDAVLAIGRDIVASDEWTNAVTTQEFVG